MSDLTADQARSLSESGLEKRLDSALKEIRLTAASGYTSCLLLGGCTERLSKALEVRGFIVERKEGDALRIQWLSKE